MTRYAAIALLANVVLLGSALAAVPVITQIKPRGVVRGEETVVTLRGTRLSDATEILCDVPGIEVLEIKAVNNGQVDVKLKTASDLAPGLYPFRLVTKSGIASLRLLGVGTMPVIEEVEPNSDFASPQKIELNTTVEGVVKREDQEYFQVALKAGQTLNVEIEGIRLANSLRNSNILDPYIAILDEGRFEVASSDDSALLQQDGFCSFTAPADGNYTILVRDSSFRGSDLGAYRLHVGTYPRPVAIIPAGGAPSTLLDAKLVFADGSERPTKIQMPSEPTDRFGVITETEKGISPSPNWIRVNGLPVHMEQEPNDDRRKAPEYSVPAAFCGVIDKESDFDCFAFQAKKGTRYRVEAFSRDILRSPLDAVINVFDPKFATLTSSDDSRGKIDPYLEFTPKEDGLHSVRIYDHLRSGGPTYGYRIEVTIPDPAVNLTLDEDRTLRRDEAHVVSVPIGGTTAMLVKATRDRYNGEVHLSLDGLPEGVTATTFPVPPGRPQVPVLLTASADAKHNASLFTITAKGDEKNPLVSGTLSQKHNLVLGQNRRWMWGYHTDRAAMAVTDAMPFKIELVQPKTPIVRNGSKSLKVRIVRDEGFKETVSLQAVYAPPGIGINNSRSIAGDKTEVDIPLTANGSAAVGKWPLIFRAFYNSPNGRTVASTNPITLEVQNELFRYEFPRTAAELGTEISVAIPVEVLREFKGEAEGRLVGLPAGVSSPQPIQKIAADATSVTFPLVIAKEAKVGKHTLRCHSYVKVDGEEIVQTNGAGEFRIDKPLPPKKDAAKPAPKAAPKPKAPAKPKPLSRLEQLRQKKS